MSTKEEVQDRVEPCSDTTNHAPVHLRPRGEAIGDADSKDEIVGYDHELMKARTLLSHQEEKKLLRRVDWHLMPLCALIFMVKNIDANNVSQLCHFKCRIGVTEKNLRPPMLVS